jgi:hypothetical protein
MEFLSGWLLFVAALRLLAVVLGYLDKRFFQEQVFRAARHESQKQRMGVKISSIILRINRLTPAGLLLFLLRLSVSALGARLFSAWCSITCALCVLLSQNLSNHALFIVTFFSFAVALVFFSMEWLVYRTVDLKGVWMQAFIASQSRD